MWPLHMEANVLGGINLLPWREKDRIRKNIIFMFHIALGLLTSCTFILGINFILAQNLSLQKARNEFLQLQVTRQNKKATLTESISISNAKIIDQVRTLKTFYNNRLSMALIMDIMMRSTPDGLVLSSLNYNKGLLAISGSAIDSSEISALIYKLIDSGEFVEPNLKNINDNQKSKANLNSFNLTMQKTRLSLNSHP